MSKARDLADFISTGAGTGILADGAISVSEISDLTATAADLNNVAGINTSVQTQLDGKQAVVAGVSGTEIGYLDGVTSNLQTQLDNISVTSGSLTKSFTSGETASITLAQAISPAPVVSATKEVSQAGQSSKGAWDVNATASNYELHNTAYATTLTPSSTPASDISQAVYASKTTGNLGFSLPRGLWFKPDGTQFFILDHVNAQLKTYDLSTAWDISTKTYNTAYTFTVGISTGSGTQPMNFWFNSSGTSLYVTHVTGVFEHTLSTAWDVSTISYVTGSNFYTGNFDSNTRGFWWKPDGTKMYVVGTTNDTVYESHFSTGFDFTTGSQFSPSASFSVASQASSPRDIQFNSSGTTMYITNDGGSVYEYSLSTAWDVTSASYTNNSLNVSAQDSQPQAIYFGDGNLYVMGDQNRGVYQYNFSSDALTLGTGSFASTDVGKRIQGNGGDVTLTSTAGAYDTTGGSAFTDSSAIASGSWSMRGLKSAGDADGIGLSGITTTNPINFATASYDNKSVYTGTQATSEDGVFFKPDGTRMYVLATGGGTHKIWQYDLSTAWDVSTASYNSVSKAMSTYTTNAGGVFFKPDGLQMFIVDRANTQVDIWTLSTAWDLSTLTYSTNQGVSNFAAQPFGIFFKPDGTKVYICDANTHNVRERTLTTAWDMSTNGSGQSFNFGSQETEPHDVEFTSDGLKMYIVGRSSDKVHEYDLSTAWDVTSASYNNVYLDVSGQGTQPNGLHLKADDQSKLYVVFSDSVNSVMQYSTGASTVYNLPTSQYLIGITNSGGQIDTEFWNDINSMTADQAAGDGTVHYAVSTDDRTTWSVAKASDGVRPIVRDNSGTWQYNNDAGTTSSSYYNLSTASYDNKSFVTTNESGSPREVQFNTNGTKMYVLSDSSNKVWQYDLSTAFDVSTASYNSVNFNIANQLTGAQGFTFNNNGTRMYVVGETNDTVYQYDLSTAFNVSTAAYNNVSFGIGGAQAIAGTIVFNGDGTKMFLCGESEDYVRQYNLSTAFNVGTASSDSGYLDHSSQSTTVTGMAFNGDGTKLFLASRASEEVIYQYGLTTAYDVSTASYDNVSFNLDQASQFSASLQGIVFSNDGSKVYAMDNGGNVFQYSTGGTVSSYATTATWANGTVNDELYTLQEALGAQSHNRMDKTQLDAVADGSHFTLGDTLDLAIALRQDTASASTPKSDGVSINYDAQALNQGAVLGTDYDYDFPDSTTVRVTSNAAQNLKVRVV